MSLNPKPNTRPVFTVEPFPGTHCNIKPETIKTECNCIPATSIGTDSPCNGCKYNIKPETKESCCPWCACEEYAEKNNYIGELVVIDNGVRYLYEVEKGDDDQYYASLLDE